MTSTLRRFSILLVVLFTITVSEAGKNEWVEVRSKHFSVMTDDGEKSGRNVLQRFEQMRAAFAGLFNKANVNSPVPLQIVAFRSGRELKQVAPIWKGKPVELAGYFQGGEDRNFIALDLSAENGWATVFHEYAHLLLNNNLKSLPAWLDEGYADFFSSFTVSGKNFELGTLPAGHGELLASNGWMKTADLLNVGHQSSEYNEGTRRHVFYAQSWLMVHYLITKKKAQEADLYLDLTEQQHVPSREAFKKAFGMTTEEFDGFLQKYFHGQMTYFRVTMPTDSDNGPYDAKPLSKVDADANLADLKFHTLDHNAEGIQEFKQVLAQDPNNLLANRGMAYSFLRRRDFDNAAPYLKRASEGGSNDPRLHFYNAMLISRSSSGMIFVEPDKAEAVRAELKKSIELDPSYADAYNLLALTYSVQGDKEEALKVQRKAVALSPRNEYYLMNLANYEMRAEAWDKAEEVFNSLVGSSNPLVASNAQQSLLQLKQMQEWKKEHPGGLITMEGGPRQDLVETKGEAGVTTTTTLPNHPVAFLKGKLLSVDCRIEPQAMLEIKAGTKLWHMRAADRSKLVLIGAEQFSCNWKDKPVAVNYRELGDGAGDLVSLELQ